MYLTDDEKKMRDGHLGEALSIAMSILVDLGEAINAPEMVEITHVHTDSGIGCGRQNRTKASSMATIVKCRPLVAGHGRGKILITQQNISFWGGVDPLNGMIIDPRHELFDQSIPGRILAFPYGKGSAAAPLVLLELAKQTTAPAAIINIETDPLLVAGPIISKHFYGTSFPVVTLARAAFDRLQTGQAATVDGVKGEIVISG